MKYYRVGHCICLLILTLCMCCAALPGMSEESPAIRSFSADKNLKADNSIPVKKIELKETSLSVAVNEQKKLYVRLSPSNASDKSVSWFSSDVSVASVDGSGTVTGHAVGIVTVTAVSGNGLQAACTVTVTKADEIKIKEIRLKETQITIKQNEQKKLYVSVNPSNAKNQTIEWSSSNPAVASVDKNGIVTGKSNGTVTITAKTVNGKTAACKVTVKGAIDVKKIKIDYTERKIKIGGTVKLRVALSPSNASNRQISWSTSDSSVAEVDSEGNVKGKSAGTAIISATSHNGKTAACTVIVTDTYSAFDLPKDILHVDDEVAGGKAFTEVESVKISGSMVIRLPGGNGRLSLLGKPVKLSAACSPATSDQHIIWSSTNEGVVSVSSDGTVTPRGYGSSTVTATANNGKSCSVVVNVSKDNQFEKTVSHTDKIVENVKHVYHLMGVITGQDRWGLSTLLITAKWDDVIIIHVDGLTGKITANLKQIIQNMNIGLVVKFNNAKMEITYSGDDYIEIESRATLEVGIGIDKIKGSVDSQTFIYKYRFNNDGTFTRLN